MKSDEDNRVALDRLTGLYQIDPDEFDRESRAIIAKTIADFPERHQNRAAGLQFRIDASLNGCQDPVTRMNKMVEIFWAHFQEFNEVLQRPEKILAEREQRQAAKIIPLRPVKGLRRAR